MSAFGQAGPAEDYLFISPTTHADFRGRRQLPNSVRNNRPPWRGQGYDKFPDKSEHAQNKYRGCDDDRSSHNESDGDLIFHFAYRGDWPRLSIDQSGSGEIHTEAAQRFDAEFFSGAFHV